jgi:hypothetical protein
MSNIQKITEEYLGFSGVRSTEDISEFLRRANAQRVETGSKDYFKLVHIRQQLTKALLAAMSQHGKEINLVIQPHALFNEDKSLGKFTDTGDVPAGGRQDEYWSREGKTPRVQFTPTNHHVRSGQTLPANFDLNNEKFLIKYFDIRAVEYGQWLTQQDRVNYLAGCALAMYDLAKILGFRPDQIGLYGLLSIAFGARGRGKALGHFEPNTFAINMTRFKRSKIKAKYRDEHYDRSELMLFSGGIGTFCHEFGHALDYYGGMFADPAPMKVDHEERYYWSALSFGRSNRTRPIEALMKKQTIRGCMERLLYKIIWRASGILSEYYKRVQALTEKGKKNNREYWTQRNELFARAFESYIIYKMHKQGWYNVFLLHLKYDGPMYMKESEIKFVEREFDELIRSLRNSIHDGVATPAKFLPYQRLYSERKGKRKKKTAGKSKLKPVKKAKSNKKRKKK